MINDNNLDDYGWYEVGNLKFHNKILAIIAHKEYKLPIKWNYNDEAYDAWKWDQEPSKSLDQLYAERAWDIRNRYDYVVLHFSGGHDSTNILETFIRNKIHLDEIITRGGISQVPKSGGQLTSNNMYGECLSQALPLAQWAKDNHYPHLKITVVDTVPIILDHFKKNPLWYERNPGGLSPSVILKQNVEILSPHYQKILDQGKKLVHVIGADKPILYKHRDYFYTKWLDKRMTWYDSVPTEGNHFPHYTELFYWGRRAIELQIKQLHVLKNHAKKGLFDFELTDTTNARQYQDSMAKIFYKRTLPLLATHQKDSEKGLVPERDSWFARDTNHDAFKIWRQGTTFLQRQFPDHFLDEYGKIQGIWSKPRFLGK